MAAEKQSQTQVIHSTVFGPYRLDIRTPIDFKKPFLLQELPNFVLPCVDESGRKVSIYGHLSLGREAPEKDYDMQMIHESIYPQRVQAILTSDDVISAYGDLELQQNPYGAMNRPRYAQPLPPRSVNPSRWPVPGSPTWMANASPEERQAFSNSEAMRAGLQRNNFFSNFMPPTLPSPRDLSTDELRTMMLGNPASRRGHAIKIDVNHCVQFLTARPGMRNNPLNPMHFNQSDFAVGLLGNFGLMGDHDRYDFKLSCTTLDLAEEYVKVGLEREGFHALRLEIAELIKLHFPFIERHARDMANSIEYDDNEIYNRYTDARRV